jgi:hypothetical protein
LHRPSDPGESHGTHGRGGKSCPKTHHFISYGQGNLRDIAAFASAKVLLEGAIAAAEREADSGAVNAIFKPSPGRRHSVVRLMGSGPTTGSGVDTKLDAVSPLLGSMSIRQLRPGEHGEFTDAERAQTGRVFEVRLAQEPSGTMPRCQRSAVDLMANHSSADASSSA